MKYSSIHPWWLGLQLSWIQVPILLFYACFIREHVPFLSFGYPKRCKRGSKKGTFLALAVFKCKSSKLNFQKRKGTFFIIRNLLPLYLSNIVTEEL